MGSDVSFQSALAAAQTYDSSANPSISNMTIHQNIDLPEHTKFNARLCQTSYISHGSRPQYISQEFNNPSGKTGAYKQVSGDISSVLYSPLLVNENPIRMAFKGSDNWFDYLRDLSIFADYSGMDLMGFSADAQAYGQMLKQKLEDPVDYTLVLTGHSLGGAMCFEVYSYLCNVCDSQQLARVQVEVFNPYCVSTSGYQNVHNICGNPNAEHYSIVRNAITSHIINSDFASILMRSTTGGFGKIHVYPDVTDTVISSLSGLTRLSYLNYANHSLANFSEDAAKQLIPSSAGDGLATINSVKSDTMDHWDSGNVNQQTMSLFNPGAGFNLETAYFTVAQLHTTMYEYVNYFLTSGPESEYRILGDSIVIPYILTQHGVHPEIETQSLVCYFEQTDLHEDRFHIDVYTQQNVRLGYLTVPSGPFNNMAWSAGYVPATFTDDISTLIQSDAILRRVFSIGQPFDIPDAHKADASLRRSIQPNYYPANGGYYKLQHFAFPNRFLTIFRGAAGVPTETGVVSALHENSTWLSTNSTGDIFQVIYDNNSIVLLDYDYKQAHSEDVYIGQNNILSTDWSYHPSVNETNINWTLEENTPSNVNGTQDPADPSYYLLKNTTNNAYLYIDLNSGIDNNEPGGDAYGSADVVTQSAVYLPSSSSVDGTHALWKFVPVSIEQEQAVM